jgi:dopamine receptor D1
LEALNLNTALSQAVTKDPREITEKRYRSIRRVNKPDKKLKMRNFHHSSPYHVSDHKAAITVGVIMGVFLGKFRV